MIGVSLHATLLVGMLSVGVLIGWISSIVPFGLGVADGGNYALFGVLGATGENGVFVTMLGRARSLSIPTRSPPRLPPLHRQRPRRHRPTSRPSPRGVR